MIGILQKRLLRRALGFLTLATGLCAAAADIAILKNGFTIRHERRMLLGDKTRLFLGSDDSSFVDIPTADIDGFEKDLSPPPPSAAASPADNEPTADLNEVVNTASAAYHLDPDLVNSVIHAESGFNTHAVSRKGAKGLMQLMPGTANQLGVTDAFDPQSNVDGGSRYLRQLLENYNFDLVKALAAYNAGPERVKQYGGVPPYRDTRAYVARIVTDYNQKKSAEKKHATGGQSRPKKSLTQAPQAGTPATSSR